jgi:hypothetical protein
VCWSFVLLDFSRGRRWLCGLECVGKALGALEDGRRGGYVRGRVRACAGHGGGWIESREFWSRV